MATTLQNSIDFARPFLHYAPLTVGTANNPAIGIANLVLSIILSPPLCWPTNRSSVSFNTVLGQQDYVVFPGAGSPPVSDFGFAESASLRPMGNSTAVAGNGTTATITMANSFKQGDKFTNTGFTHTAFNVSGSIASATPTQFTYVSSVVQTSAADTTGVTVAGQSKEIGKIHNNSAVSISSDTARPNDICVFGNDGAGNITFRFISIPDTAYKVTVNYQKAPVLFTSLSSTWGPALPDSYSDIFNNFFLGYAMDTTGDPRAAGYIARGGAALLAKAEGLTEMEKAVFMAAYLNLDAAQIVNQIRTQQGAQARGTK